MALLASYPTTMDSNDQSQPYVYPTQQPQGSWTPSIAAQPFYPSFYQQPQQPQQQQQQQPQQQHHYHLPQPQYFDPNNAQLAQWAYHQMMLQQSFTQQQQPFNPFPPPQNHNGFHPYRRPNNNHRHTEEWRPPAPYRHRDASGSSSSINSASSHTGARSRTNSAQSAKSA